MAPKATDQKPKSDWSCRFCTKGAKKALRKKGFCNYKNKMACMECDVPKKDSFLCAFADLPRKLSVANGGDRGGPPIPGTAGAKNLNQQKPNPKQNEGQTKREAALAKENAELKKQLGLNANVASTDPKGPDVEDKSEQVAKWRKYSSSHAVSLKHAREEFVEEGVDDDDKAKRGIEFDGTLWATELKAKIAAYQIKIEEATSKEVRAKNVDAEILEQERQLKHHVETVKKMTEQIATATKKHDESAGRVTVLQANLVKLKEEKAKFMMEQGRTAHKFDSFFEHEKFKNLVANTCHGEKAAELLGQLTSLMQASAAESSSSPNAEVDADMIDFSVALEEADEDAFEALADAQANAVKAGKQLTKEESKEVLKSARASAKASGKFSLIMRSKKANGKPKLVGDALDD